MCLLRLSHFHRFVSQALFIIGFALLAFASKAFADANHCPKNNDHSLSAVHYKLFGAFHTGYDGYAMACELKCFGKQKCQDQCQLKKGMDFLSKELDTIHSQNNLTSCYAYQRVCFDICKEHPESCSEACGLDTTIASAD